MKPRTLLRSFVVTAATLALGACGTSTGNRPASFASWQTQMQAYVNNQANGDMNALRDVTVAPGQPGFRAFSNDRPEKSKDIAGVLVGLHSASEGLWYVYLVGEVDKESTTLIRPVAVSQRAGQFEWRVGDDAAGATAAYRQSRTAQWSQSRADAAASSAPPPGWLAFPSDRDRFSMSAAGDAITIREDVSRATWSLLLTQPSATPAATSTSSSTNQARTK